MLKWLRFIFLVAATHSEKTLTNITFSLKEENHTTQKIKQLPKRFAVIDGPPLFGRDARAFCCSRPEGGSADPKSPDAATELPCCSCDFFFVRMRRHRCGEQLLLLLLDVACDCSLVVGC